MWYYFIFSSKFGCRLTDIAECLNKLHLKIFTPGYVILALKFHKYLLRGLSNSPLFPWWVKLSMPVFFPISISVLCVLLVPPALPCSCHQILTNADLKGTFAPGGCACCYWAPNKPQICFLPPDRLGTSVTPPSDSVSQFCFLVY